MTELKLLQKVVDELNATNSTNDKKDILSKYKDNEFIKKVLFYTYNPTFQYYVTPDNLEKNYADDLGTLYQFNDLFEMLDILRKREVTGHKAINSVNDFCYRFEDYKDLIYKIIGKDLEIRMGDSLINKVIPGLIPSFDVALAANMEDVKIDFVKDTWYSSRKLDGVRCLAVVDEKGNVSLWSRQGNEFETLQKVKDEIVKLNLKDKVLDGEICLIENFYEFELENGEILRLREYDTVKTSNGVKLAKDCTVDDFIYKVL
jgi:DNA ligase-1